MNAHERADITMRLARGEHVSMDELARYQEKLPDKLRRSGREIVFTMAVLSSLFTIASFLKGIWTPDWRQVGQVQGFTNCGGGCWQYQGNTQWLWTAGLFLVISVVLWFVFGVKEWK